jgi:hypothetical protein
MSSPYSSPPSNLRSLRDRLVQAAKREGLVFGRLQQHVAVLVVAQLAARLTDAAGAPLLLVKGGSSLELRRGIGDSRTSRDLDAVARHDVGRYMNCSPMRASSAGKASLRSSPRPRRLRCRACRSSRDGS